MPETRRPKPAAMVNSPDLEEAHRRVAKPTPSFMARLCHAHACSPTPSRQRR